MNLKTALLAVAIVIVASQSEAIENSGAVQLGDLQLAGSACTQSNGSAAIREVQAGVLDIPITLAKAKAADKSLERGTCQFALPVQVAAGYRLVISDVAAKASLKLNQGSQSRLDLEIFKAGIQTKPMTAIHDAKEKKIAGSFRLSRTGKVVVLACGEDTILRGNASVVLQGAVAANFSLDAVRIKVRVEKCL